MHVLSVQNRPMKNEIIALAANVTDLAGTVPTEIQLTPAGLFKTKDGRPVGLSGWIVDSDIAAKVIALADSQITKFCIDYDHKILTAKDSNAEGIAAGWFSKLEYREGVGIFAIDVEWTALATSRIQNKEYRYISPVLSYDKKTGAITKIWMAALTNNPALDSMKDLCALATDYFSPPQDSKMEEIDKLKARIVELEKQLADAKAACSTETPVDLSQHVPVEAFTDLQKQHAALSAKVEQNAVDDLVKVGLSDGRITPTLSDWAKGLPHEALSAFLDKATPIAALSGSQTGGTSPAGEPEPELLPEELAVCSAMGLTHDQFIATKGTK